MRTLPLAPTRRYYAALGDVLSMDALGGGGPGTGAASRLLRDLPPDLRLIPLAMDGATTTTVRYVQLPRLRGMDARPSLVTVTLGATDLLLSQGREENARAALAALREHGGAALAGLRDVALPGAPLVVATVPDPTGGAAPEWAARFSDAVRDLAREHGALVAEVGDGPADDLAARVHAAFRRALADIGLLNDDGVTERRTG